MIIVEGPDGAGKSTLIKHLGIERVVWMGGVRVKHPERGVEWAHTELSTRHAFFRQVMQHQKAPDVAFDRFHLSERVYGPLLRGEQALNLHSLHWLNDALHGFYVPVILCLPPFETTYANVTQAGRERPKYQTDEFLRAAYDQFSELTPWATIVYDFTSDLLPRI